MTNIKLKKLNSLKGSKKGLALQFKKKIQETHEGALRTAFSTKHTLLKAPKHAETG